jgi:hypothetical protein
MAMHSESTTKTYLYLRVGLVALAVFLGASLVIELAFGDTTWQGSISAYYYTPVRSVFVGTLTAMGVCLIAIKGRDKPREDLMLNLAGMCAPVVAMVPTPLVSDSCGDASRCVPASFVPGVVNNVEALLVVGALALLFAARTVRRDTHERGDLVALGVAAAGLVGFALWFAIGRDSFLRYAHYGTAVPMFGLIVGVALVNAARVDDFVAAGGTLPMGRSSTVFRRAYRTIAYFMGAVIAGALVLFVVKATTDSEPFSHWVFVVEALLLVAFTAFWILQTVQYAEDGAPE